MGPLVYFLVHTHSPYGAVDEFDQILYNSLHYPPRRLLARTWVALAPSSPLIILISVDQSLNLRLAVFISIFPFPLSSSSLLRPCRRAPFRFLTSKDRSRDDHSRSSASESSQILCASLLGCSVLIRNCVSHLVHCLLSFTTLLTRVSFCPFVAALCTFCPTNLIRSFKAAATCDRPTNQLVLVCSFYSRLHRQHCSQQETARPFTLSNILILGIWHFLLHLCFKGSSLPIRSDLSPAATRIGRPSQCCHLFGATGQGPPLQQEFSGRRVLQTYLHPSSYTSIAHTVAANPPASPAARPN